jgi:hypothetical protein
MGTWTEFTVADYPLLPSKSEVIPVAMTVFRETDRRVFQRRLSERNELVWGRGRSKRIETAIEYSCKTGRVIDRLNIMGFNVARARREFDAGLAAELEQYEDWAQNRDFEWAAEKVAFLRTLTFDAYVTAFTEVIRRKLRRPPFEDRKKVGLSPTVKYIVDEHDEGGFGFFGGDIRLLIRLACEVVPPESMVVQDITSLVGGGYYGPEEPVCEDAIRSLTARHPENSPRIILTEGATDTAILKDALSLLFPHLLPYYTFLDFDSSRSQGGAGHLVALVKAFAGAGVTNRLIALFDNDTAAHEATRSLSTVSLPTNIAVLHYPPLNLLRRYPTIGPGGVTSQDVNGLAASIELYLGKDVLQERGKKLTPVQWKGYSEALRQYQGEVMHKTRLYGEFAKKVERCKANPSAMKKADWSGLTQILQDVFSAFE